MNKDRKKSLLEKIENLFSFLERVKNNVPTRETKAEFSFHFHEFQEEVAKLGYEEVPTILEELKKPIKSKDLTKTYSVYYKLYESEQNKNKWKVEVN